MRREACLIHNPVAGKGDPEADLTRIRELLEPEIELDIRLTTKEVDAEQLAIAAVKEGASMIIVSGGDGTVSAAAEALVRTCIPIGVIARGTANAFAKALGILDTLEAACQTLLDGCTRVVDAAVIGPNAFTLDDKELIGGKELLVVGAIPAGGTIDKGKTVLVKGSVRKFVTAEIERDFDFDLQPELEVEYEGKAVVIAQSTQLVE